MLLDELIAFDRRELTSWKLLYSYYKMWWLIVLGFLFLCVGCCLFMALYVTSYFAKGVFLILMLLFFLSTFVFSKKKTLKTLIMQARQHNISVTDIWKQRGIVIEKIRLKKLSAFIESNEQISITKIEFFREELAIEQGLPRYKPQFSQIALPLISVILAAFFTAVTVVKDAFTSFGAVITFFKPYAGLLLTFLLLYWYFEKNVLKWMFEINLDRSTRLRKVLGDYLSERL